MSKVFEDALMDVQSELISLCLEVVENRDIDKVYVYCSIEKKSMMFNAFFEANGKIQTLDQFGIADGLTTQFLRLGTGDLNKVKDVCKRFERTTPTEIKMVYEKKTDKFGVKYRYDEVCSAKTGICAGEVFDNWITEVERAGNNKDI